VWEGPGSDADEGDAELETDVLPHEPVPALDAADDDEATQVLAPRTGVDAPRTNVDEDAELPGGAGADAGQSLSPAYGEGELGAPPSPSMPAEPAAVPDALAPTATAGEQETDPPPDSDTHAGIGGIAGAAAVARDGLDECAPTQVMLPAEEEEEAEQEQEGPGARGGDASAGVQPGARADAADVANSAMAVDDDAPAAEHAGRGPRSRARAAARPPPIPHRSRRTKELVDTSGSQQQQQASAAADTPPERVAGAGTLADVCWTQTPSSQLGALDGVIPARDALAAPPCGLPAADAAAASPAAAEPAAEVGKPSPPAAQGKRQSSRAPRATARGRGASAQPAATKPSRGRTTRGQAAPEVPEVPSAAPAVAAAQPAGEPQDAEEQALSAQAGRRRRRNSAEGIGPAGASADAAEPSADKPLRKVARAGKGKPKQSEQLPANQPAGADAAGGADGADGGGDDDEACDDVHTRRGRGAKQTLAKHATDDAEPKPAKPPSSRARRSSAADEAPKPDVTKSGKRRYSSSAPDGGEHETATEQAGMQSNAGNAPAPKLARGAAATTDATSPVPDDDTGKAAAGGRKRARTSGTAAAAAHGTTPPAPDAGASPALEVVQHRPGEVRVIFTCFDDIHREAQLKRVVRECGGKVLENASDAHTCTHCVVDRKSIKRTVKLCIAVSRARHLVDGAWLEESARVHGFVSEASFALRGRFASASGAASKWSFDAEASMARAAEAPCLRGCTFLLTKSVMPKPDDLGLIIEAAGGKVTTRLPPTLTGDESVRYYAVSCPADTVRCMRVRQ